MLPFRQNQPSLSQASLRILARRPTARTPITPHSKNEDGSGTAVTVRLKLIAAKGSVAISPAEKKTSRSPSEVNTLPTEPLPSTTPVNIP